MRVKIGDKIYDSIEQPILLILDDVDKQNISNMSKQNKYCAYSENTISVVDLIKFMEVK